MRIHCTVIPTLSESLLPIGSAGRVLLILCHIFIATSIIRTLELASKIQVAIWPVTGQGFQNTKWPAVLYSQ